VKGSREESIPVNECLRRRLVPQARPKIASTLGQGHPDRTISSQFFGVTLSTGAWRRTSKPPTSPSRAMIGDPDPDGAALAHGGFHSVAYVKDFILRDFGVQ